MEQEENGMRCVLRGPVEKRIGECLKSIITLLGSNEKQKEKKEIEGENKKQGERVIKYEWKKCKEN